MSNASMHTVLSTNLDMSLHIKDSLPSTDDVYVPCLYIRHYYGCTACSSVLNGCGYSQ